MNKAQEDEYSEIMCFLRYMSENCEKLKNLIQVTHSLPDFSEEEILVPDSVMESVINAKVPLEYTGDTLAATLIACIRLSVVLKEGSGYRYCYKPYMLQRYAFIKADGFFDTDCIEILSSLHSAVFLEAIRGISEEYELKEKAVVIFLDDKGIINRTFISLVKNKVSLETATKLFDHTEILINRVLDIVQAIEASLLHAYSHTDYTLY